MRLRTPVRILISALLLMVGLAEPLRACSVPVFRYALERWPADDYRVTVVHRGQLTEAQQNLVDRLDPESASGPKSANIRVQAIDLDKAGDDESQKRKDAVVAALGGSVPDQLPVFILHYPVEQAPAWSGPLTEENVARLVDSPVRREIARRLLKGETGVWVFVEGGNKEEDDKAYETLKTELAIAGLNLKLPEIDQQDVTDGLVSIEVDELKIAFSLLRVSRDDAAEGLFVQTLLGSEGDGEDSLRDKQFAGQPMAFPVFGRGRALYGLVGKGINGETITTACATLVGPCTCEVKDKNPGIDLPMSISWDELVKQTIDIDKELPPLAGLTQFGAEEQPATQATPNSQSNEPASEPVALADANGTSSAVPAVENKSNTPSAAVATTPPDATALADATAPTDSVTPQAAENAVLGNTLIVIGIVTCLVIAVSVFLVRRG